MAIKSVKEHFEWAESGQTTLDGHDLATLANTYPTPFYLLSQRQLRDNLQQLCMAFAGINDLRIYYSIKSNYESLVLRTLAQEGTGAEISGALDLELAQRAGFPPEAIVYDSPYKAPEVIEAALRHGIYLINIDSLTEARHINDIAERLGKKVNVGMRVDPLLPKPSYDKVITTYKRKFGLPLDQALATGTEIARMPNLNLIGLMSHIGSQIFAPRRHVLTLERLFGLAVELGGRGVDIEEINLGGGYPAPSMRNIRLSRRFVVAQVMEYFNRLEAETSTIEDFGAGIAESYNSLVRKTGLKPRLAIEPGRYLVANACMVVGRVVVVKNDWIFTDVSINDVPESLFFSEWRLAFPGQLPSATGRKYNIAGPTLLTQDVLFFQREVPEAREGAPFVILDAGAYSISRANQFTRPRIACYGIEDNGTISVVRRAETVEDVLSTQVWPDTSEQVAAVYRFDEGFRRRLVAPDGLKSSAMTGPESTDQHAKSFSIAAYAAELARSGIRVLPGTGGTIWVQHDAGAMMRVPRFHLVPPAPREARKVSWRGRVAASSYLLESDDRHPANACLYVCTDRAYALDKLPPAMRRNVRRGLRDLRIAWLTPDELFAHGFQAFCDTRRRVGLSDGTPEEFRQRFGWRAQCQGHVFLGAWKGDQLAAFLSLIEVDDWVEIESCYSMNALLNLRPNDTLMYSVLSHSLCEREYRVVCYGLSSIQAENNAAGLFAFKMKVGFEARPVHRAFVLHPCLRLFANRLTLWGMNAALRFWPRGRILKKAEGMLAYVLGEVRLPEAQAQTTSYV